MNDKRRSLIRQAKSFLEKAALLVERAADEEQDSFDNLPENIQDGERGEKMEAAIELMEDASDQINEILDKLSDATR